MADCCKKYSAKRIPKGNCSSCWDRWFNGHLAGVHAAMLYIGKHGEAKAVAGMGTKALKQLKRFIVAHNEKQKRINNA